MKLEFREWNARQKVLRHDLEKGHHHQKTIELFLEQHAMVHDSAMVASDFASFSDDIWKDIREQEISRIPRSEDYSIVWVIWHMARIEDMTMNILVAGTPLISENSDWLIKVRSPVIDTGNGMDHDAVNHLSRCVDIDALRQYRYAVGRRTREIVSELTADDVKKKVDPARIQQVVDQKLVVPEAMAIVEYWSKRTIA
ncbi:MAG: DinB family protein [Anaerolineae bacterium]|nr:DinB family protein [Anaerolineae bacterium]